MTGYRPRVEGSAGPPFAQRATAAVLAGVLAMQTAACGTAPKKSELEQECGDKATRSPGAFADRRVVFEYRGPGDRQCTLAAPPGNYRVVADVAWSNGWTERAEITTDIGVAAGDRYVVRAHENEKGRAPVADVELGGYISTPAKVLIMGTVGPLALIFVGAVAILTLPFTLPIMFMNRGKRDESKEEKPTARPSKDCCSVWIERGATGEVVAGEAPAKK